MIRVKLPLDLHTVCVTGCGAFALATPVRVRRLIELAVREVIGSRAPRDKIARSVRATLAGLAAGRYTVNIDGRAVRDVDAVVVCDAISHVRFYLPSASMRPSGVARPER